MGTRRGLTARLAFAAALLLAVVAPARADPALWKVTGPNATVYLFGTMHLLPKGLVWEDKAISSALASSHELYMEIANPDDIAGTLPIIMQLGMDMNGSLLNRLNLSERAKLDTAVKGVGLSGAAVDHMRPWMVALLVEAAPALQQGYDPQSAPEAVLSTQAKGLGIAVLGLETAEQQAHMLADMPDAAAMTLLRDALNGIDSLNGGSKELAAMLAAWKAGDTAALSKLAVEEMRQKSPALYDRILASRNRDWASKLEPMLRDGHTTEFVAVGAGHLVGPDSVVALLEKDGFTVTRVEPN